MATNSQKAEPPPGFFQFEGQSPDGSGQCFFVIARDALLKHFRDTGNKRKLLEGYLIPEVLDAPAGTWQNLRRPGQEDTLCYAGIPSGRFVKDTTIEVSSSAEASVRGVRDHETRFGKRLWPQD